jgi:hypothetical protein
MFNRARSFARAHPWKLSLVLSTTKAVAADLVAQKVVERKEYIDRRRVAVWATFGAVYGGTICHCLYQVVFPRLFPIASVANTIKMNLCDNFLNTPFIFFPCFYTIKEAILSRGTATSAWTKYKDELWEGCVASWYIWIPAHLVTFGVVPVYLRISFATVVSFLFYVVVSFQQSGFDEQRTLDYVAGQTTTDPKN